MFAPAANDYAVSALQHSGLRMKVDLDATDEFLSSPNQDFPVGELFAASSTAVIIANGAGRILAANPAAQGLLEKPLSALAGTRWHEAFGRAFEDALRAAGQQATALGIEVKAFAAAESGRGPLAISLSPVYVSGGLYLLVRLNAVQAATGPTGAGFRAAIDRLDALPFAFAVTDGSLFVQFGNRAFLDLVNLSLRHDVENQSLLRWVNLAQADLARMHQQMRLREAGMQITTTLCVGSGAETAVQITAIAVPDPGHPQWGFLLRKLGSIASSRAGSAPMSQRPN